MLKLDNKGNVVEVIKNLGAGDFKVRERDTGNVYAVQGKLLRDYTPAEKKLVTPDTEVVTSTKDDETTDKE